MAVGIIAAQSIGEPGTQLTMRTFHTGGVATRARRGERNQAPRAAASSSSPACKVVTQRRGPAGRAHPQRRNRDPRRQGPRAREVQGALRRRTCWSKRTSEVKPGTVLCQWDPHLIPILAEVGGIVRFEDIERRRDGPRREGPQRPRAPHRSSSTRARCTRRSSSRTTSGKILDFHYLPAKARIEVDEGEQIVAPARCWPASRAKSPARRTSPAVCRASPRSSRPASPRSRRSWPRSPASVEILRRQAPRQDDRSSSAAKAGMEKEHHVPHDKHLLVHAGDFVEAGDPLVEGPLVPHDILRITGEEALQQYLLREVQNVYRSQSVNINDKHIEIIVAQMLRKVQVETAGDTNLLPGEVVDKFRFRAGNERAGQVRQDQGPGRQRVRRRRRSSQGRARAGERPGRSRGRQAGQGHASPSRPRPARCCWASPRPPCRARASSRPPASRRPPRCSPRRPWPARSINLVGLKENVILGHLIPAGTGFRTLPGVGSPHPARGARGAGRREGQTSWPGTSRCWRRPRHGRARTADGRPRPSAGVGDGRSATTLPSIGRSTNVAEPSDVG